MTTGRTPPRLRKRPTIQEYGQMFALCAAYRRHIDQMRGCTATRCR